MPTKTLWELDPENIKGTAGERAWLYRSIASEAREWLHDYETSGNGAHVWRAWRCVRLLPEIPADLHAMFVAYFDAVAASVVHATDNTEIARALRMFNASGSRGEGNAAAEAQRRDNYLADRFRHLLSLPNKPTKTDVYARLADEEGTTPGAMKQRIMRVEGAGQYGTRSRRRKESR